jgi:hypothetical protein
MADANNNELLPAAVSLFENNAYDVMSRMMQAAAGETQVKTCSYDVPNLKHSAWRELRFVDEGDDRAGALEQQTTSTSRLCNISSGGLGDLRRSRRYFYCV